MNITCPADMALFKYPVPVGAEIPIDCPYVFQTSEGTFKFSPSCTSNSIIQRDGMVPRWTCTQMYTPEQRELEQRYTTLSDELALLDVDIRAIEETRRKLVRKGDRIRQELDQAYRELVKEGLR